MEQLKQIKVFYTFHMDGSKREHNVSGRENINGPSVVGDAH